MPTIPQNLINPHNVFANGENVDLSQLILFAELKVTKRNRLSNASSAESVISINFLGNSPEGFTTDFTENKENIGITKITYRINASYVPQVDIEILDVRGQSLFNDNVNSKYKVIFDMPPPIYELTLKGYYGQAVKYRLHLLKVNSKLNENGSDVVTASFVGMTFAPLADLLIDYLDVAPFLSTETKNSDGKIHTVDLQTKSKDLISEIKTASAKDVSYLDDKFELLTELKSYQNKSYIDYFISNLTRPIGEDKGQNNEITAVRKSLNKNKVDIGFKWFGGLKQTYADDSSYQVLLTRVEETRQFFAKAGIKIKIPTLPSTTDDLPKVNYTTDQYQLVTSIDFTNVDSLINDSKNTHAQDIYKKQEETKALVSSIAYREIKGGPTLRNVLNILLSDALLFCNELKNVVNNAANNRKGNNDKSHGEAAKYPFPLYFIEKRVGSGAVARKSYVRSIPQDTTWDEVNFVDSYINAKAFKVGPLLQSNNNTFSAQNLSANNFVPMNPFDGILTNTGNIYTSVNNDNIIDVINRRAGLFCNMTVSDVNSSNLLNNVLQGSSLGPINLSGLARYKSDLIKYYATLEAYNILGALRNQPNLLNALITKVSSSSFDFATQQTSFNSGGTILTLTGATTNTTYQAGQQIALLKKTDFDSLLGVPDKRRPTTGTDNLTNAVQDLVDNVEGNIFTRFIRNEDKFIMSQYNVPFAPDTKLREGDDNTFNNKSDFFVGTVLFKVSDSSVFSTADNFLSTYCSGRTYIPFELDRFKLFTGIYEVPFFILAWWGYLYQNRNNINILSSDKSLLFATLPQLFIDIITEKYNDFTHIYNVSDQVTIQKYLLDKSLTSSLSAGGSPDHEFFSNGFVVSFSESFYLVLGDKLTFNGQSTNTINFATKSQYLTSFYSTLKNTLKNNKNVIDKQQQDDKKKIKSKINDDDLRTELYYGFKSFVDRWMLDSLAVDFNKLLDVNTSFLLVDRGFNDIGDDLMLDLTPLASTETTADTSLYTILLNLLSKNNIEFFALPTYVDYKNSGVLWNSVNLSKIFGTYSNITLADNPKFICMYVGGTSAQLDMPKLQDDAISHDNDGGMISEIKDLNSNSLVQAFSVSMGTQNQSFFKEIQLDQAEFKETNESINMLDRIAKSGEAPGSSTEIKSNNLYNVYQQRSYTATVNMLGNVMIQPTMYFQLENISMWKGTYLITDVTHTMTPNHMDTSFKGVRVPKYMKPYISDFSIIANVGLGSVLTSEDLNGVFSVTGGRGVTQTDIKDIKSALPMLGNNTNQKITPEHKALLDVISYTEGTMGKGQNGYDVLYSGKLIPAWSPNYSLGHGGDAWKITANNTTSTAAGRYQFLYGSWVKFAVGSGSTQGDSTNKPFSQYNQDLTGAKKIDERLTNYRLDVAKIDQTNFIQYTDVLAMEWASFPFYGVIRVKSKSPAWTPGRGFYDGQGGRFTVDELWIVYSLALSKYKNGNSVNLTTELNNLAAGAITPAQATMIATLNPAVQSKFTALISQIQQQTGYLVNITSAYRNYAQQEGVNNKNTQNALPGTSLHEYGLACDFNLQKGGNVILKNNPKTDWMATGAITIAKNLGFAWGGDFNSYADNVHFEILQPNGQRYSGTLLQERANTLFGSDLSSADLRKVSIA